MKSVTILPIPPYPDFSLDLQYPQGPIIAGKSMQLKVNLTSLNGYSGTVYLHLSLFDYLIRNVTATLASTSLILHAGNSNFTMVTINTSKQSSGQIEVQMDGTDGHISHYITIPVRIVQPSYIVEALYAQQFPIILLPVGSQTKIPVFVSAIYNFTGFVSLSYRIERFQPQHSQLLAPLPTPPLSLRFSPSTVDVPTNRTASVSLTIMAPKQLPLGNYSITIIGNSPSGQVGSTDFDVSVSSPATTPPHIAVRAQPSVTVRAGHNATIMVQLKSLNNFSGAVSVSIQRIFYDQTFQYFPEGSELVVNLEPGQTMTEPINLHVNSNAPAGQYLIIVQAYDLSRNEYQEPVVQSAVTVHVLSSQSQTEAD
jgi:hypothetical protein